MRGADSFNESLFSTVRLEEFMPASHPLRPIRTWVNGALAAMDTKFSAMYETPCQCLLCERLRVATPYRNHKVSDRLRLYVGE